MARMAKPNRMVPKMNHEANSDRVSGDAASVKGEEAKADEAQQDDGCSDHRI
jgi:hypothetical protein